MKLLTTAPPSVRSTPTAYLAEIANLCRWCENTGVEGMLIYTDNSLADPWAVAQAALACTERFVPLVATQPLYMHPLAAARKIATLGFLYGRRIALNMVAGGFVRDLTQLGDQTEHDARYDRLVEYTQILMALLRGETVTFTGSWYQVESLSLSPPLDPALMPELYLSGASDACIAAAATLGATRLSYTKPPEDLERAAASGPAPIGLRVGIIARPDRDTAWQIATTRFPPDRRGQLAHRLARGTSDSVWHKQISGFAEGYGNAGPSPYWLEPLKNYKTFCPYLVGSYDEVASYVARYRALGYGTLILDVPQDEDDLIHTQRAMALSRDGALGLRSPA